jgi:hydrogenase maturation protease
MSSPAEGVLVIGYGNPLRGDDGFGPLVVERLTDDARLAGACLLARHQLTPELAEDVARARLVAFVDARLEPGRPGRLRVERAAAAEGEAGGPSSHHMGPDAVLALSDRVYGRAPPAVVVSVTAGSVEAGEGLTSAVAAAVDAVVETIAALAARSGAHRPTPIASAPRPRE